MATRPTLRSTSETWRSKPESATCGICWRASLTSRRANTRSSCAITRKRGSSWDTDTYSSKHTTRHLKHSQGGGRRHFGPHDEYVLFKCMTRTIFLCRTIKTFLSMEKDWFSLCRASTIFHYVGKS